ncbi:MAG: hypothetical protein GVY36_18565 [Verrucomicrobia bacterium]|jgi:DNA-binding NtrC family response regulator|nr:hypothetical protein [Verrucomicrobiota bacterium]
MNRPPLGLAKGTIDTLCGYDWPGNVRELQNVIERGLIMSRGGSLQIQLPVAGDGRGASSLKHEPDSDRIYTDAEVRKLERANIIRALQLTDGKVAGEGGAAELLGIRPSTLASRMKSMNIRRLME